MVLRIGDYGDILDLRENFLAMERESQKASEPQQKIEALREAFRSVLSDMFPSSWTIHRYMDAILEKLVEAVHKTYRPPEPPHEE